MKKNTVSSTFAYGWMFLYVIRFFIWCGHSEIKRYPLLVIFRKLPDCTILMILSSSQLANLSTNIEHLCAQ